MTIPPITPRSLGTMVTYGYRDGDIQGDLALGLKMGVACVEILPLWKRFPDPKPLGRIVGDHGLTIHSAHGCWGGQAIRAKRVDLGSLDASTRAESLDDLRRCVDWIAQAGGRFLIVHPGGLSDRESQAERTAILADALNELADSAAPAGVVLCVENMPPGVHPGTAMADLASLVAAINRPEVALALDTGHAHLSGTLATETQSAGTLLATTHVHDNHGKADAHLPPGQGTIDWNEWVNSLDLVGYQGPIMLECIRYIRDNPDCLTPTFLDLLSVITRTS